MLYSELSPEQISNLVHLSRAGRLSATEAGLLEDYLKFAEEQEYLLCEQSLYNYLVTAWRWFDPSPFSPNWHLRAICEHVQACFEGEFQKLMVTVPPRCCKSSIISVAFPTWAWGPAGSPATKFITASYGDRLATRDAVRSRRLLNTAWFQKRWGSEVRFRKDSNLKTRYDNERGGFRMSTSVGGAGTGEGYDVLIIDDPMKAQDSESRSELQTVQEWWQGTMSTRKNDPATAREILIMQRLNEDDLAGLAKAEGDWVHLNLPMEYESTPFVSLIGWKDPRSKDGELLWPDRFPRSEVDKLKTRLGPYRAAAQLQQRPAPLAGGLVKTEWLRYYTTLPDGIEYYIQTWDLAFDDTANADYTVGQCWAKSGANKYLVDQVRDKLDAPGQIAAMQSFWEKYPTSRAVLVENKANGPAIMKMLKRFIPRLLPLEPKEYGGSKEQRLHATIPDFQAGNVFIPLPDYNPWVKSFLHELQMFPKGAHDDTVDCAAYALSWISDHGGSGIVSQQLDQRFREKPAGVPTQARQAFGALEEKRTAQGVERHLISFSDIRSWW